jgi:hypothetical protein
MRDMMLPVPCVEIDIDREFHRAEFGMLERAIKLFGREFPQNNDPSAMKGFEKIER